MFAVKPIKEREIQSALCERLGAAYHADALAYYAADLDDNGRTDEYIGICQFVPGDRPEILCLKAAEGREDDDAMIVMLRTVMSFLYRCGSVCVRFAASSASPYLLERSGFPCIDGVYIIDLTEFYKSPCRFGEKNDNR